MQGAGRREQLLECVDDFAVRLRRVGRRVRERSPVDGRCLTVHVSAAHELADHGARAARALEVFRHPTPRPLQKIFRVKRAALRLHRVLIPEREVLNRLARDDYAPIDAEHRR